MFSGTKLHCDCWFFDSTGILDVLVTGENSPFEANSFSGVLYNILLFSVAVDTAKSGICSLLDLSISRQRPCRTTCASRCTVFDDTGILLGFCFWESTPTDSCDSSFRKRSGIVIFVSAGEAGFVFESSGKVTSLSSLGERRN